MASVIKKQSSRLRFQISISAPVARLWQALAKSERRNRSNMLEVLIEQEHARRNSQPAGK